MYEQDACTVSKMYAEDNMDDSIPLKCGCSIHESHKCVGIKYMVSSVTCDRCDYVFHTEFKQIDCACGGNAK